MIATSRASRREILAWATYDWANSAYSAVSITVLAIYITKVVLPGKPGELAWSYGIGLSTFVAAMLSPILGAAADARANKRFWLGLTALSGSAAAVAIGLTPTSMPWVIVGLFIVTTMCFELSLAFYNAFLPELADDETTDMVSAIGFALGYVGGGVALLIAIVLLQFGERLGLPAGEAGTVAALRLGLLVMGCWWGLFSLPAIFTLRDRAAPRAAAEPFFAVARRAVGEVATTLRHIRAYRALALFLVAFLLYNDGVQTVISQSTIFAQNVLKIEPGQLVLVFLFIQFAALPGAMLVGWLSRVWGQKPTLVACIVVWISVLAAALFVTTIEQFWVMSLFVALVMGGTQSVSRAIMSRLTPPERAAEFFGFFNFSGKATSFAGPIVFGTVLATTGSAHIALVSLLGFFLVGGAMVLSLDLSRGRQ